MPLQTHGDLKYASSKLIGGAVEWAALRVEFVVGRPCHV
jgi:hypothetical protein